MTIRAILFDIDGVLIDSVRANAQFYRDILGHFGFRGPTDAEMAEHNHLTMKGILQHFLGAEHQNRTEEAFAYGYSAPYDTNLWTMPPDAKTAIPELAKTYTLGLVSSRTHKGIENFTTYFGMQQHFAASVGFEDTQRHKPNPDPILKVLKMLNANAAETVYIGDAQSDVDAGHAAGVAVVIYGSAKTTGEDARITSLTEITATVSEIDNHHNGA